MSPRPHAGDRRCAGGKIVAALHCLSFLLERGGKLRSWPGSDVRNVLSSTVRRSATPPTVALMAGLPCHYGEAGKARDASGCEASGATADPGPCDENETEEQTPDATACRQQVPRAGSGDHLDELQPTLGNPRSAGEQNSVVADDVHSVRPASCELQESNPACLPTKCEAALPSQAMGLHGLEHLETAEGDATAQAEQHTHPITAQTEAVVDPPPDSLRVEALDMDFAENSCADTLESARSSSKEKHAGQPSGVSLANMSQAHFESDDPAITQLWVDCKSLRQEMAELLEIVQRTCRRCRVSPVHFTPSDLTPRSRGMSHRSELRKLVEALCLAHESAVAAAEIADSHRARSPESLRRRQSSAPARASGRSQHVSGHGHGEKEVQRLARQVEFLQRKLHAAEASESELRAEVERQASESQLPRSRSEGAPERAPEPEPKATAAESAPNETGLILAFLTMRPLSTQGRLHGIGKIRSASNPLPGTGDRGSFANTLHKAGVAAQRAQLVWSL